MFSVLKVRSPRETSLFFTLILVYYYHFVLYAMQANYTMHVYFRMCKSENKQNAEYGVTASDKVQ